MRRSPFSIISRVEDVSRALPVCHSLRVDRQLKIANRESSTSVRLDTNQTTLPFVHELSAWILSAKFKDDQEQERFHEL
jgi:hypothetical protein